MHLFRLKKYLLTSVFLLILGCQAKSEVEQLVPTEFDKDTLINILKNSEFSGIVDENISINFFGNYKRKAKEVSFYIYEREFGNSRLTQRLIFILDNKYYLGMYAIPDFPTTISKDHIVFPFTPEDGNTIFLGDETLPKQIFLDGELVEFFK